MRFCVKREGDVVTVEDTTSGAAGKIDHETFVELHRQLVTCLGDEYFHQAMSMGREHLENWIAELDLNAGPNDAWIPALETILHHRFLKFNKEQRPQPIETGPPTQSPEEIEKQRQMAFFRSSSHDPTSPWSPQKRS